MSQILDLTAQVAEGEAGKSVNKGQSVWNVKLLGCSIGEVYSKLRDDICARDVITSVNLEWVRGRGAMRCEGSCTFYAVICYNLQAVSTVMM